MADFDVPEYKNNSHWVLPEGAAEDSNYVCYYDAASLYPSSGKTKFVFFGGRPGFSTTGGLRTEDGGLHRGCNTLPGMRSKHSHAVHTRGHVSHTPRMS